MELNEYGFHIVQIEADYVMIQVYQDPFIVMLACWIHADYIGKKV
jgi:hypothetical protein